MADQRWPRIVTRTGIVLGVGTLALASMGAANSEVLPEAVCRGVQNGRKENVGRVEISKPQVLLRMRRLTGAGKSQYYPFDPVLSAGSGNEVRLVTTAARLGNSNDGEVGRVTALEWRDGSWSEPILVAASAEHRRFGARVLSMDVSKWFVSWFESKTDKPVESLRLMGAACVSGRWSEPQRLTDEGARDLPDFPPAMVESVGEVPDVYWVDGREARIVISDIAHPRRGVTKVYTRPFGETSANSVRRVTPARGYVVAFMSAVRRRGASEAQVVFFKEEPGARRSGAFGGGSGLFVASRMGSKWARPSALMRSVRDAGTNELEFVRAFGHRDGTLSIVYPAIQPGLSYIREPDASELGVFTRTQEGRVENNVVASGVSAGSRDVFTVKGDIGFDGKIGLAYQGVSRDPMTLGGPMIFALVENGQCVATARISEVSTVVPLFDVAVDSSGRTHIVWVEDEGEWAILNHSVVLYG